MEKLKNLNAISKFEFGVLSVKNPSYLKFENEVYIDVCSTLDCDLVTLWTIGKECVVVDFEDSELEFVPGETYFLKPIPERIENWRRKIHVRFFKLLNNVETIVKPENQLAFKEERFIDLLRDEIKNKKLLMTCWPFRNISLKKFLDTCGIPHQIFIQFLGNFHAFDPKVIVTPNDNPVKLFPVLNETRNNGTLFCYCNAKLKMEIVKYYPRKIKRILCDLCQKEKELEKKPFFIIFNHKEPTNGRIEKVLRNVPDCCDDYILKF